MRNDDSRLKIVLFGNVHQERKSMAVERLLAVTSGMDVEVMIPETLMEFIKTRQMVDLPQCKAIDEDETIHADVAVCLGGDGTFLDAASRVGRQEIPIVGINTGRLGFLANFSPDEMEGILHDIYENRYEVEERCAIELSCEDEQLRGYTCALNEIAILKHDISAMISIQTSVNGEYLTTYQADGLIVGTPTGSTAYSLSVGGPVMVPQLDAISLTPVAPHSLNMRPIIVSDDAELDLRVESRSGNFLVSLDGRSDSYRDNIHLHIRKAPYKVKVVVHPKHSFFSTLRHKMMWGTDVRR